MVTPAELNWRGHDAALSEAAHDSALPPIFNDKMYRQTIGRTLPLSIPHSRGEILRFRSPGIQTTNKTAVTRAPLAGRNAFQAHRKEA